MSVDLLRLDCDNLVIGAGIAGLVSALRLNGRTIIAAASLGATAISGGVLTPTTHDDAAENWFMDIMQGSACPYCQGRCMTDMLVHCNGLVQEMTNFQDTPVIISVNGIKMPGAVSLAIAHFSGRSYQEIAHMIESDEGLTDHLVHALAAIPSSSYLLPPVLGITRSVQVRSRLEKALGARVYEYVTAPSVHGLRLQYALRDLAIRKNIMLLETTRIESIADGARGHMGTKGKREVLINATNVILATGGPLTGLSVDGDRVYEPLTDSAVGDLAADLDRTFISSHAVLCRGIGNRLPARGGFRNVRAVGALASGFGLYRALVDGYHAGDDL